VAIITPKKKIVYGKLKPATLFLNNGHKVSQQGSKKKLNENRKRIKRSVDGDDDYDDASRLY
jgi:hypothetical protein